MRFVSLKAVAEPQYKAYKTPPLPDPRAGCGSTHSHNLEMKTYTATPKDIKHDWFIVDAEGMVLGRLAVEVAKIIRGKHKAMYTPTWTPVTTSSSSTHLR